MRVKTAFLYFSGGLIINTVDGKKSYEVAPERTSGADPILWSFRRPYLRKFRPDLDNEYLSKKARSSPMQTEASSYDLRQF